ncbi:MAG TPA: 5-formyltetrahydrofolate cyclo-ligase [Devosia sp.]|nr:5-formyltetrahydrofolate cyclo-ligase [Devosia sp.]
MSGQGRWAGRNAGKDVLRSEIWHTLEMNGTSIGPAWSLIPNFVGADVAAWHLAQTDEWKRARTVKTNPDAPQIPIRLRALYEGKIVYAPVPYLTRDFPYLRIDPKKLIENEISFEMAATSQGFMEHGDAIHFEDVEPLDFCVVGSVAVGRRGGRTGKGAGFADLETAIFRELGVISDTTPIATTVHSSQLVDDNRVVIEAHDSPLDLIATELELIRTRHNGKRPAGVDWDRVQPDQYASIPVLSALRQRMEARRAGG